MDDHSGEPALVPATWAPGSAQGEPDVGTPAAPATTGDDATGDQTTGDQTTGDHAATDHGSAGLPSTGDEPARGRRSVVRRSVSLVLVGAGLAAIAGGGFGILTAKDRPPTKAQLAASVQEKRVSQWRLLTAGQIFPATVSYPNAVTKGRWSARLIGVAPQGSCDAGTDPAIAAELAASGCEAVLRATYADASGTLVATVGVAIMPSQAAAAAAFAGLAADPNAGVRAAPFADSPAGLFGDAQRAVFARQYRGPYVYLGTAGFADGRVTHRAGGDPAVAGLADGVVNAVARALSGTAAPVLTPAKARAATQTRPDYKVPANAGQQLVTEVRRAWQTTRGSGVTVAVLSTGVDPRVPGLAGRVVTGPDYVGLPDPARTNGTYIASAIAGSATSSTEGASTSSESTSTASTGSTDNPYGSPGIAPGARILSVRVYPDATEPGAQAFDATAPFSKMLANGIRYAVAHGASVIYVDQPPVVHDTTQLEAAVKYALSKNVVVTALAVQSPAGPSAPTYPAAIPGVVAAGMVTLQAPFQPTFGAPVTTGSNESVLASVPDNPLSEVGPGGQRLAVEDYGSAPGWIAGTAALIKSEYPELPAALVARAIALAAQHHPRGGYDTALGFGVINPAGALTQAATLATLSRTATSGEVSLASHFGSGPPPGVITVTPASGTITAYTVLLEAGVVCLLLALVVTVGPVA